MRNQRRADALPAKRRHNVQILNLRNIQPFIKRILRLPVQHAIARRLTLQPRNQHDTLSLCLFGKTALVIPRLLIADGAVQGVKSGDVFLFLRC